MDYTDNKVINKFGMRAGFQMCLEKNIKNELKIANLITSDNKQIYKPKTQKIKKRMKNNIELYNEKYNGIRGVRDDGFDIYKPTKMLKGREWDKDKKRQPITGVVLKVDSKDKSQVKKDVLFQKVFLEKKKSEIQEMEKKLNNKMIRENLTKKDVTIQKTIAQINNEQIIKELNNFTIKPQYRREYKKLYNYQI